mgnify:CR=1 FL=1
MRKLVLATCTALFLLIPATAPAQPTNEVALKGVDSGKVVWNITLAKPRPLTLQMKVIRQTYMHLEEAGLDPRMVLAFHSRNVHYLAEDLSEIPLDIQEPVKEFSKQLAKLLELEGVRVEACGLANQAFGMENEAVRDGVAVVKNSYVSFIGYQNRGYAIIGIH